MTKQELKTTPAQWNYTRFLTVSVIGLMLIGTGLTLAAFSNPANFSPDPGNDHLIDLCAVGGLLFTMAGILLFYIAVCKSAASIPVELRTKTNVSVGIGFVFQLIGLYLIDLGQEKILMGGLLFVASLALLIYGATHYAEGKGYSNRLGLLGLLGILGFVILILLPWPRSHLSDRKNETTNS